MKETIELIRNGSPGRNVNNSVLDKNEAYFKGYILISIYTGRA